MLGDIGLRWPRSPRSSASTAPTCWSTRPIPSACMGANGRGAAEARRCRGRRRFLRRHLQQEPRLDRRLRRFEPSALRRPALLQPALHVHGLALAGQRRHGAGGPGAAGRPIPSRRDRLWSNAQAIYERLTGIGFEICAPMSPIIAISLPERAEPRSSPGTACWSMASTSISPCRPARRPASTCCAAAFRRPTRRSRWTSCASASRPWPRNCRRWARAARRLPRAGSGHAETA